MTAAVGAVALLLGGCASDTPEPAPPTTVAPATAPATTGSPSGSDPTAPTPPSTTSTTTTTVAPPLDPDAEGYPTTPPRPTPTYPEAG